LQKRQLLESELVAAVRAQWSFAAVEKFVQEVYWRTYWKGWLEQRPAAWSRWQAALPVLRANLKGERRNAYTSACTGHTGIACFDAWARELVATGYLHNHARMWFASIWIFTLRLPWELGAAFFYEHLLDGDAASNTLSWRWVAGLQTQGKTYLARADNISRYTDGVFAPEARDLASEAFEITEEPLPKVTAWTVGSTETHATGQRPGLWLHAEDIAVECGELALHRFVAVHAPWPKAIAQQAGWGERVTAWTSAALDEGAQRASQHFKATLDGAQTDNLGASLVTWAKTQNLTDVVAYRPFIGPWHNYALEAEQALGAAGINLVWKRRQWDTLLFPHATRGYFPFWQHVQSLG
jgi:deoxyribodipyrimidine photo-lyase